MEHTTHTRLIEGKFFLCTIKKVPLFLCSPYNIPSNGIKIIIKNKICISPIHPVKKKIHKVNRKKGTNNQLL